MAPKYLNVLVSTFDGLGLPTTLVLPTQPSTTVTTFRQHLNERLPETESRLILTTLANRQLPTESDTLLSSYLPVENGDFLSLRLGVPLCGGKGGFGSQLRAAGGRMSSRKKKTQDDNGSSRNLDGRRLRTVNEAKALAEYLAIKPDMDKKEKEKRRARWEEIVQQTEAKEAQFRNGGKSMIDGKWAEDKEESSERAREAVLAAMKFGNYTDNLLSSSHGSSSAAQDDSPSESDGRDSASSSSREMPPQARSSAADKGKGKSRAFVGFDEDDEFMSSDDESENGKS